MARITRVFSIIAVLVPGLAVAQPGGYDLGTTEIDGVEIRYVKDELLIKPVPGVDAPMIADELQAAVIDSIPRIGWFRLRFQASIEVLPIWELIRENARIQSSALHEILSMDETEEPGSETPGSRDGPPAEIQWPLTITGTTQAWNQVSKSNVLVAILDTGIDFDHYHTGEFSTSHDRIEVGRDWYDYYGGRDWQPAWDEDTEGPAHGTHRVGEIAAPYGNGGIAGIIAGWDGPDNQKCKVLVEKIAQTINDVSAWGVAAALDYVVFDRYARVVSFSYSGAYGSTEALWWDAFSSVNSNATGTVVLCCSGNRSAYVMYPPAAWSCVLECVIAVGASDQNDGLNYTTQWMPGPEGGTLSFLAPGKLGTYWATSLAGEYDMQAGGTSAATAHAAGITAMMISKYPQLENDEIKDRLQDTAFRISVEECSWGADPVDCWGHTCYCIRAGSGRIDAVRCLRPRYQVLCPRGFQSMPSPYRAGLVDSGMALGLGEIAVYDLLGRQLCSYVLSEPAWDKAHVLSHVKQQGPLPTGAKIIRFRSDEEVHTWRLAP